MRHDFKCLLKPEKRVETIKVNRIIKFLLRIRWLLIIRDMLITYLVGCGVLMLLYCNGYFGDEVILKSDFLAVTNIMWPTVWGLFVFAIIIFKIRRYKKSRSVGGIGSEI